MTKALLLLGGCTVMAIVSMAWAGAPATSGPTATGLAATQKDNPADWPPTLDTKNTYTKAFDARPIERYTHGVRPAWGYHAPQRDYFFLVKPADKPVENAPLYVVLHSAGHDGTSCVASTWNKDEIDIYRTPKGMYGLYVDCRANSKQDWWWGDQAINASPDKYSKLLTPTENRVLDEIEWVISKYKIDRNRVYLCGMSMGGSGSLGIGLNHGDIFASMYVWVPAGTHHAKTRMGWTDAPAGATQAARDAWLRQMSAAGQADPPPVLDLSATNDDWSKDQGALINAAKVGRLAFVMGWAPIGHVGAGPKYHKEMPEAMAFPWLEIRKNEAYPAFTNASSDQLNPWTNKEHADPHGQINAFFRWKNVQDTPTTFTMKLWLSGPTATTSPAATTAPAPKEATADVTLRRLQQFKVQPGKAYVWSLKCSATASAGSVTADAAGLLTIPGVRLSAEPWELTVRPE